MGETDTDCGLGVHQGASGTRWGMWYGNGALGVHSDQPMTQGEVLSARAAAGQGEQAFRQALPAAARSWYDGLPANARACILADATYTGAR